MNPLKIINAITIYRIVAAPLLLYLAFTHQEVWFKWLLPVSFFTDLIDGFLARRFKVTTILGARLDSIGDDLTVAVAVVAMFIFHYTFIIEHEFLIYLMLALFIIQLAASLIRYRKISSFHTFLAKLAAILQGTFLILTFLMKEPNLLLFYVAASVTALELAEEIILVFIIKKWKANVGGIYWVVNKKKPWAIH